MSGSSSRNPGLDPEAYRRLMSQFPTGVTVATTMDLRGRPQGMTASAVTSVSLEPPLVLVCVNHAADFHGAMSAATGFALNVLSSEQEHLSRRFAEERSDRFDGVAFHTGPGGLPLLAGVVAHVVCEKEGAHEAGDHTVFIGRVTGGDSFGGRPLVHFQGGYSTTAEAT